MKRGRSRTALVVAGGCLIAALVATASAHSARAIVGVTSSHITSPKDLTYLTYDGDTANTFAISGTSNGTTGEYVDIRCYDGDIGSVVASSVALKADGSFSVPAADPVGAFTKRVCNLHAVPAGTTPADPSAYPGPRLLVGKKAGSNVSLGPNDGALYDYYLYFQQLAGGNDYDSLGGCGVDDGYLLNSSDAIGSTTWYCNAALFNSEANTGATRSEVRVDGANAYTPTGAKYVNDQASSGFPAFTYSYNVNPHTGNAVIHETNPLVKCPVATYPPTNVSCATFANTGVTDTRTITQDHAGRVAWITDMLRSTDGQGHTVDFLWDNEQRFHPASGDSTQLEYKFPGEKGYSMHVLKDSVKLPATPGTIFVRMHGTADGDMTTGRGAIVYDRPAAAATFTYVENSYERFTLHQTIKIPAKGSIRIRFAYVDDFHAAAVATLAKHATTVFTGCTVPNVVGETLSAAKKAITHAHCAVGMIRHSSSATVAKGHVVAETPSAKTHVDYGSKVRLVVSSGL
jgi:hypothetical protein